MTWLIGFSALGFVSALGMKWLARMGWLPHKGDLS